MRLSELLGRPVRAADGTTIGNVHDVRLVQDGPLQGADAAFRVHGLVVGPGAVATRLGYGRAGVRGPWLLKVVFERRRSWYVPWSSVQLTDDGLRFDGVLDDLGAPEPLDGRGGSTS